MKLDVLQTGLAGAATLALLMLVISIWAIFSPGPMEFMKNQWEPLHPWHEIVVPAGGEAVISPVLDIVIAVVYGLLDGFIIGTMFAFFINLFYSVSLKKKNKEKPTASDDK